jgi:DnaJ-class molecular chaperone
VFILVMWKRLFSIIYEDESANFVWIKNSAYHIKKAYLILLLEENASQQEIKRAFRKLASRYHPDKFQDAAVEDQIAATQKFLEIKEAYDYLMD